jgi:hypothetical protein
MSVYALVLSVDLVMPLTVLSIWWTLHRARCEEPKRLWLAVPFVLALTWGAAWSFYPPLSALRFLPPPSGQAGAILGLIVGLILLQILPSVQKMFRTINMARLVDIGVWRIVYGAALLLIGLQGGLPSQFFWSAAIGDILVGLWAISIIARRPDVSRNELMVWNGTGMLDLLHVLALGALYLPTFYKLNPEIAPLNLLPLVGVPCLLVMHILTLMGQKNTMKLATARQDNAFTV